MIYERDDMLQFVKMLEGGFLAKGRDIVNVKAFGIVDWKESFDAAAEHTGIGKLVIVSP
jgi:hypothetical protein